MPPRRIAAVLGLLIASVLLAWLGGGRIPQPTACSSLFCPSPGPPVSSLAPPRTIHRVEVQVPLVEVRQRAATAADVSLHQEAKALPQWAVPFGNEFWLRGPHGPASSAASPVLGTQPSPVDLRRIVERVSCAFVQAGDSQAVQADGGSYRARVGKDGLRFLAVPVGGDPRRDDATGGGFVFWTRSAMLGDEVILNASDRIGSWQVVGNTAQRLLHPERGWVEHYQTLAAGVEVSWLVPERPEGKGDLAISLGVEGMDHVVATASGLHLVDASGRARARVGKALAVDSLGSAWEVPVLSVGDSIEVRVPGEVLGEAVFPLAIDPLVSAEFDIDVPIDGPPPSTRSSPAVAAGASVYLVAWTHGRGEATDAAICAARVGLQGELLDPYGILVSAVASEHSTCAVGANPGGFLVVWSALRGASSVDWDVLGARVQEDGTLADVPPIAICAASGTVQCSPAVAGNGESYLAVWRDSRSTGIYGTLVGSDGRPAATNGMAICTASNEQYQPAVGAAGTNFLVAWQDYRKASSTTFHSDIYGARVSGAGQVLDGNGLALCTRTNAQNRPAVAGHGDQFLVVWEAADLEGTDIMGTRVGWDGVVRDPGSLTVGRAFNAQSSPAVAACSNGFVVAWQDLRASTNSEPVPAIRATLVDSMGEVHETGGFLISPEGVACGTVAVAGRTDEALVFWQEFNGDRQPSLSGMQAARVASVRRGEVGVRFPVPKQVNAQVTPAVASLGDAFLVAWSDNRGGEASGLDIYGARVSALGGLMDPSGIQICGAPGRQSEPAVAGGTAQGLIVWTDWRNSPSNAFHGDIHGRIVTSAGLLPDAEVRICSATNDQSSAAVAASTTGFWVVWQDARNTPSTALRSDIFGARLDMSGRLLDFNGFPICAQSAHQMGPAVAAAADGALVVWTDFRNGAASDIYGAHLGAAGTVMETNGFEICRAANNQSSPAVAGNGLDHLVVWTDARNGASNLDVFGGWVSTSGAQPPTNGFPIHAIPGNQTSPAVQGFGGEYLVVWQTAPTDPLGAQDLAATRFPSGAIPPTTPLWTVDGGARNFLSPGVAIVPGSAGLVVSQGASHDVARTAAWITDAARLARLSRSTRTSSGSFSFQVRGAAGSYYEVQTSEDLRTWIPKHTLLITHESVQYIDASAASAPNRFYRVILLP